VLGRRSRHTGGRPAGQECQAAQSRGESENKIREMLRGDFTLKKISSGGLLRSNDAADGGCGGGDEEV
jgi:hypothetical protein